LLSLAGQESERSENGLRFLEADVDLTTKAPMPTKRCAGEALRSLVSQEKAELEGFREADVLEL
jgi:hypothetical protein